MQKNEGNAIEEKILDVEYAEVMQKSYIDYAMSVIVSRAIPDVRDGLKPVQRRIIYDMSELGISSDKAYRKSARIVGDTMGKYHPHGDSSIYEALVVMSQDFKKGSVLVDGHGNFGSIEGDGAAADRYTEARLEKYSEEVFLKDLGEGTVDFVPNYDESEKEPVILPCRLPNLLVNGAEGIAVGMATSIPPHNVSDVVDATIHYMEHPDADAEELFGILKGPDFPTGGIVSNASDLPAIYETGTGKIKIRGKVVFEKGKGNGKDKLVITEIPYTMIGDGISKLLQAIADLVENKVLTDIVDITNQTSKDGIRIVLELKKNADVQYIENMLYKKTKLEDTFGVNMLAVHNQKPEVMGLKAILDAFLEFQYEINDRKYQSLLAKAEKRKEVLEGLVKATDIIDLIIEILRGSRNIRDAKKCLMDGDTATISFKTKTSEKKAGKLSFTELQADAILEMKLSRLIGLELKSLEKELTEKTKLIAKFQKILESRTEMKKTIKKDLVALKDEFGKERLTQIIDAKPVEVVAKEEEEMPITVLVDKFFYMHSIDRGIYEKNRDAIHADYRDIIQTTNKAKVVVFCNSGKAHVIKACDIPYGRLRDKGKPIENISNFNGKEEDIIAILSTVSENPMHIFLSTNGFVKQVDVSEFDVTRKTVDATKLKDDGKLLAILPYNEEGQIVIGTKGKSYIRFKQPEIPVQKKNAVGAMAIKLSEGDEVSFALPIASQEDILQADGCEFEAGKVKMMRRGGKGTKSRLQKHA